MFKKALFLIFITSLSTANENKKCTCNTYELTTTEKVVIGGVVGAGAVIAAPYVLPASTIAAISAAITAASAKTAAYFASMTAVGKISLGLSAAQLARPYVLQTTEEKLKALLEEKAAKPAKAKAEFISCLKTNKSSTQRNSSGRPEACEEAALLYAFSAGVAELNKKTKQFKDGQCFCG